jgi:hypothetical protein
MKVDVNWVKKTPHYRLKAKNISDALAELKQRDEWGLFEGHLTTSEGKVTVDGQGNAKSIRLVPSWRITMPSWPAYAQQSKQVKESWDTMYRALEEHENGHRDLFLEDFRQLQQKLEALDAAKGVDVQAMIEEADRKAQTRQDKYDVKTNHGKDTVHLDIPPSEKKTPSKKPKPGKKKQGKKRKGGAPAEKRERRKE